MLRCRILFFIAMAFMLGGCTTGPTRPKEVRLKIGSDPKWLTRGYNDTGWNTSNGTTHKGIYTMRFHFQMTDREKSVSPFVVQVIALGSYDAYWDGRYIGSSGKVAGTKDLEVPGYHHLTLSIGDTISKPGHHVLALRISNFHHQRKYTFFNVHAGTYEDLNRMPQLMLVLMSMLGGIFLIGAIYYLFLYRAHLSEPLFLVFAILCLLFLVLLAAEYMPAISNYAYPFQFIRLEAIGILTLAISILIPYFLNRQFGTFGPYLFNSVYIFILLAAFIFYHGRYDLSAKVLGLLTGIACLVVVLRAALLRIQGYLGVLAALSASLMTALFLSFDYSLYISFGLLLVSMLYLLSKRSEKMMGDVQQNMLLSERLKTELLKKSIQPHFLMNSLTALTELVEQSPNEGISMITALAGEFELLSEMAEKKLVPIEDEIALCNFHLDIMRYRKDINYLFTVEGIDPTESIPPAIIHTALENGVTHSRPLEDGTVRLHLCYSSGHTARSYTLRVRANNSRLKAQGTGTGFKYIRARLNESYGNNWHFESHAVEDGWVTKVTINR